MITSSQIKQYAIYLGFDACGICKAEEIDVANLVGYLDWLNNGYQAGMDYMGRNVEKRCNPTLLEEGAKSIICVALNYYPEIKQSEGNPQFAYYAYGKDYHDVMKAKLNQLFDYIRSFDPKIAGRVFVDTAPMLERYWAAQSGIGFIGKNSMLIIPKKGSYFFLGEVVVNVELEYDKPLSLSCGNCTRCLDACPTKAIVKPKVVNANKCISYQTIENKGEIDEVINPNMNNRFYGCDICQQICPWNRYARPHTTPDLAPSQAFLDLSFDRLESMTREEYQQIFKGSAVKRAKYEGLQRNLEALKASKR